MVVNGEGSAREGQLVVLSQKGEALHLSASSNAKVLLMAGEPLQEPIVGYGPCDEYQHKSRKRFVILIAATSAKSDIE